MNIDSKRNASKNSLDLLKLSMKKKFFLIFLVSKIILKLQEKRNGWALFDINVIKLHWCVFEISKLFNEEQKFEYL